MKLPDYLQKDLLTTTEIAKYLRITSWSVILLIQKGLIKGTQMTGKGSSWVVHKKHFTEYLREKFEPYSKPKEEEKIVAPSVAPPKEDISFNLRISTQMILDIETNLYTGGLKGRGFSTNRWILEAIAEKLESSTVAQEETTDAFPVPANYKISPMANEDLKVVTCRILPETFDKIDKERIIPPSVPSRSAYVGYILDEFYVHRTT